MLQITTSPFSNSMDFKNKTYLPAIYLKRFKIYKRSHFIKILKFTNESKHILASLGNQYYEEPDNESEPNTPDKSIITKPKKPSSPRPPPPPPNGETTIPAGCAAALKCVQEIYCTVEGFVSPVPVVLTKEQELLRAPTTVSYLDVVNCTSSDGATL